MRKKTLQVQELEDIVAPMALFAVATRDFGIANLLDANISISDTGPLGGQGVTVGANANITPINTGIQTAEIGLGIPPASAQPMPTNAFLQDFDLLYGVKTALNISGNTTDLTNLFGRLRLF